MRTIEYANVFKKDYKQIKATPHHAKDAEKLLLVGASSKPMKIFDGGDSVLLTFFGGVWGERDSTLFCLSQRQ
jgi:hypothetical protein